MCGVREWSVKYGGDGDGGTLGERTCTAATICLVVE